jgi:glutamate synthase (NADPH/NADH) large chain
MNPYLAFDTLSNLVHETTNEIDEETAHKHYIKAVGKGMMKVMSKMGISTYQSYCGAQIFDAVGLSSKFVEDYFTGTATKVEGAGLVEIAEETERRHATAYGDAQIYRSDLDVGGDLAYRIRGEEHVWTPETIGTLQHAVRSANYKLFKTYTSKINDQTTKFKNLRGLFDIKSDREPVSVDEVEPILRLYLVGSAYEFGQCDEPSRRSLQHRGGGRGSHPLWYDGKR